MEKSKLICVTNRHLANGSLYAQLVKIFKSCHKPDIVILREKDMQEDEYKELAVKVIRLCRDNCVACILHLFQDVAADTGADGIHLPFSVFNQMPESKKKKFNIIGVSVHSREEAADAQKLGASYIIAGHIFQTGCKKGIAPRGLAFLNDICSTVDIPVYAIGGIDMENAASCIEAGAAGICMMSGFMRMEL
ncbi:MAG TPA: thiamine phosphate synthase [Lachnospiraceae bacterium]|nr:thiamine phosphate synthase [Lachnospiraceae bacterium]